MNIIKERIKEKGYLIADGATGTNLFSMGLESGYSPEFWNVEYPNRVAENHSSFIDAGSDIILTNTFGANSFRLKLHNAEKAVKELNYHGASIAKKVVADSNKNILIAGSIGPTGEIIEPLGTTTWSETTEAFSEQAKALKEGGVDFFWIETMSSEDEMRCALDATKNLGLPTICSYSFDTHGKSMMGLDPKALVSLAEKYYPDIVGYGANCGIGASELIGSILCFTVARENQSMIIVAKANCGIPEFIEGVIEYNGTEQLMADYACYARDIGATIIGGCCGTTHKHVTAMSEALKNNTPGSFSKLLEKRDFHQIELEKIIKSLGDMTKGNIAMIESYLTSNGTENATTNKRKRTKRRLRNRGAS
jgi:5-methyltetrahydrofolate--homocysteine methyltransferase